MGSFSPEAFTEVMLVGVNPTGDLAVLNVSGNAIAHGVTEYSVNQLLITLNNPQYFVRLRFDVYNVMWRIDIGA